MRSMREQDLDTAISELIQTCSDSNGTNRPFFFIVGAGISCPIIETATGLMRECKEIALRSGRSAQPDSQDNMVIYSHWMEAAFPQAEQRRRYLEEKILNKNISPATLRLAHLLQDGRIARTVVTPNFDDFLTRALTLFGVPHVVCDHPHTVRRLAAQSEIRQILHVHGTYWFYDCCNLEGEIEQRTQDGAASISSFLTNLLWQSSPIVIGYSGWEDDVIMTALKSRLTEQALPFNIYWFCYDHNELRKLPSWLTRHQNIRFVTPKISSNNNDAESPISLDGPPGAYLDAVTVLGKFVESMNLAVPPLFDDPLRFFATQIKDSIYLDEDYSIDIYGLRNLVSKIENAADRNQVEPQSNDAEINSALIEKVINAARRADYRVALSICARIEANTLKAAQRDDLVISLLGAIEDLPSRNADLALQACRTVLAFSGDIDDPHISIVRQTAIVHTSYTKGRLLMQMERNDEAVIAFDLCIRSGRKFKHDMPKCSKIAEALFNKGFTLELLEQPSQATNAYNELWMSYADQTKHNQHVRQLLARARTNMGMAIQNSNEHEKIRYSKALVCFRDVFAKFGNETDTAFHEPVAKSLVHVGMILYEQQHFEEAIQSYDEVLNRYGGSLNAALRDPLIKALVNKGMALERLNRYDDALNCCEELVRHLGATPDPSFHPVLVDALDRQGRLLARQGDHKQALTCFDIAAEYADESNPDRARILANRQVALRNLSRGDST